MNKVSPVSISVVIPTYGRNKVLTETIDAVLRLNAPPTEIIVVDQSARHCKQTDRQLGLWQEEARIKWMRLLEPSIPRAMNQGLLAAKNELVLFLDDDIIPSASLVMAHQEAHFKYAANLIAGRVLQSWHNGAPDSAGTPFGFNSLESHETCEFMGGNFSVVREEALKIGGFDENFVKVAYRFEAEFAHRWRVSGRRIWYESSALIHHLKVSDGGTRAFGDHLRSVGPAHTVGAHYFLLKTGGLKSLPGVIIRIVRSVKSRHHLMQPWWIPVALISEVLGLVWAAWLVILGPRHLQS